MLDVYLSLINDTEDKTKFEKIYSLYEQKMYAVAFKIVGHPQDAEDVVYESFLAIIENLDKISEIQCHKTWNYIVTIVKSKAINLYRKKKNEKIMFLEDENILQKQFADEFDLEEYFIGKEKAEEVAKLLLSLPEKYRYVLYLYYYQDMTFSDVAKNLQISEANARQIAKRAKRLLETEIKKRGEL